MGLYSVMSGDTFYVKANSEDEAYAKYVVSQGHMSVEDYPEFDFSTIDEDIEEGETDTIVEPVMDFSVSGS